MTLQKKKSITAPKSDEITELLRPIPGDNQVGLYIRYEPIFDDIVTARTQEDANLPQGIWERELKNANWPEVVKLCKDFLNHHSKDLQIAAWLMQAWYHTKSLDGLTQGFHLFNQLCIDYWEQIHPQGLDSEESIEIRSNIINWIDEKLVSDLHRFQVTKPDNPKTAIFTFGEIIRFAESSKPAAKSNIATVLQQSQDETPVHFYQTIISDTTIALDALENLENTLENRFGNNVVSLTQIQRTLEATQNFAQTQYGKHEKKIEEKQKSAAQKHKTTTQPPLKVSPKKDIPTPKNINHNSEYIYQRLEEIITELKQIHPQSPAPYLIKKAITIDQQSLQEWMQDLDQHKLDVLAIQKWLGILPQNDG